MILNLKELKPAEKQQWLQHAIAPRPICFASTMDREGNVNLSPFSFFNLFSSNPPIVIFSPSRRVRDNSTKHTLQNVQEVPEVVINIVDYDMVQQTSLASCEYAKGTDEFIKAGFTKEPATIVRLPMLLEAKVKLECEVQDIRSLGLQGGAGQLVICEVLAMHVDESILNEEGTMIDQKKLQLVARLGGNWYCKVDERNLFEVEKPNTALGIGIDSLPEAIKNSRIFSGNHLGQLANVHQIPTVDVSFHDDQLKHIIQYFSINPKELETELQLYARTLLDEGNIQAAWQVLLYS